MIEIHRNMVFSNQNQALIVFENTFLLKISNRMTKLLESKFELSRIQFLGPNCLSLEARERDTEYDT